MKFPNKVILYKESVISLFPNVLSLLSNEEMSATELFLAMKNQIVTVSDFIDALDCLYALCKISLNPETRRLTYVI